MHGIITSPLAQHECNDSWGWYWWHQFSFPAIQSEFEWLGFVNSSEIWWVWIPHRPVCLMRTARQKMTLREWKKLQYVEVLLLLVLMMCVLCNQTHASRPCVSGWPSLPLHSSITQSCRLLYSGSQAPGELLLSKQYQNSNYKSFLDALNAFLLEASQMTGK